MKLAKKPVNFVKKRETACIQCAKCAEVCPRGLYPVFIREAIQAKDMERAKQLFIMDCVGCVICTNACPSGIMLADSFREARTYILERTTNVGT
jgi:electron transport complex protein RnfC